MVLARLIPKATLRAEETTRVAKLASIASLQYCLLQRPFQDVVWGSDSIFR